MRVYVCTPGLSAFRERRHNAGRKRKWQEEEMPKRAKSSISFMGTKITIPLGTKVNKKEERKRRKGREGPNRWQRQKWKSGLAIS